MGDQGSLNVRDFGAVGDGAADDTAAFQKALDAAAEGKAIIRVPAGAYAVGALKLHPQTGLWGDATWSYRDFGGSVLRLIDPDARCLLDLTGAVGATVNGLSLDGGDGRVGGERTYRGSAHGVMIDKGDYGREEDVPRIERCRIGGFAGDGIHLGRIWCWSVRHCMVCFNGGHGIRVRGWDGFLLDTWLSGNVGAGYFAGEENASTTITANRIEWNRGGGIFLAGAKNYNITGNYLDRSGGCGIRLARGETRTNENITITGNVIFRSGRPGWREMEDHESSHAWLEAASGVAFCGNTMRVWRDDGPVGEFSPDYGVVYRALANSLIKNNVLHDGALWKLLVDLHDHGQNVSIADNVGRLFVPPKT